MQKAKALATWTQFSAETVWKEENKQRTLSRKSRRRVRVVRNPKIDLMTKQMLSEAYADASRDEATASAAATASRRVTDKVKAEMRAAQETHFNKVTDDMHVPKTDCYMMEGAANANDDASASQIPTATVTTVSFKRNQDKDKDGRPIMDSLRSNSWTHQRQIQTERYSPRAI